MEEETSDAVELANIVLIIGMIREKCEGARIVADPDGTFPILLSSVAERFEDGPGVRVYRRVDADLGHRLVRRLEIMADIAFTKHDKGLIRLMTGNGTREFQLVRTGGGLVVSLLPLPPEE